jgi:hypothetical protein
LRDHGRVGPVDNLAQPGEQEHVLGQEVLHTAQVSRTYEAPRTRRHTHLQELLLKHAEVVVIGRDGGQRVGERGRGGGMWCLPVTPWR